MPEGSSVDLAIECQALRKDFGNKVAVRNLTLSIRRGEAFGFLGPNGAGKTTSMKMLLGLVRPTAGLATVLGARVGDTATRARLGFLPEHFRFHDSLTGRELLTFHGRLLGLRPPRLSSMIGGLLDRLGVADADDRRLSEYSKGMLQRIGLAQALLGDPDLVFLDEPTSGLDPLGRLLVRDVIRELRARGTAVFLNSHLLSEVEVTCDRVAFVKDGSVVRHLDLHSSVGGLDVEARTSPLASEVLSALAALAAEVRVEDGLLRLRVADEEAIPPVVRCLVESGAAVYRVLTRHRSLEAVFIEVMGADGRAS
jgi:ABC-2 type transport system ATP-binding protein